MTAIDPLWLAVALSGAILATWILVVVCVPAYLLSAFRCRLWRVRDAVMDDLLHGRLPDHECVREFVSLIESFIDLANRVSLFHVLFVPLDREGAKEREMARTQAMANLGPEANTRLCAYQKDFRNVLVFRLFLGSVAGWVFLILLLLPIVGVLVVRAIRRASIPATDVIFSIIAFPGTMWRKWRGNDAVETCPDVTETILTMPYAWGKMI